MVVGLASLASYFSSQWRARQGRSTLALAGIGIGTALLLAAVFLVVLGVLLLSHDWLARLDETAAELDAEARDAREIVHPFAATTIDASSKREPGSHTQHDARQVRSREEVEPAQPTPAAAAEETAPNDTLVGLTGREQRSTALLASDPWAATGCVVPFKREWNDGTRWTIVNDCGAAVAIVIATCERSAGECASGSWRYPADGDVLPAKQVRSTTQVEETQYATELRHAACVVTDRAAVNLIGIHLQDRAAQWPSDFEEARAHDACLTEVRRLTRLGIRSGVHIEALVGAPLYSRAEQ